MIAAEIVLKIVLLINQNVKTMEDITMLDPPVLNVLLLVRTALEMVQLVHHVLMALMELIVHQLAIPPVRHALILELINVLLVMMDFI